MEPIPKLFTIDVGVWKSVIVEERKILASPGSLYPWSNLKSRARYFMCVSRRDTVGHFRLLCTSLYQVALSRTEQLGTKLSSIENVGMANSNSFFYTTIAGPWKLIQFITVWIDNEIYIFKGSQEVSWGIHVVKWLNMASSFLLLK